MVALEASREILTERIQAMDMAGLTTEPQTDIAARVMKRGQVDYNVQSTVDDEHRMMGMRTKSWTTKR